ncbi:ERMIN protein, partial [Centropus bengalensis]|nr:ERMIN protein [Centropus bengalensis]
MTEEAPVAASVPECNGSIPSEKGSLPVIADVDEIARAVGMVPYTSTETSPDAPLAEEILEKNRNSLAGDVVPGDLDGEKRCAEKQEESDGTRPQGSADTQDMGTGDRELEEAAPSAPAGPGGQGSPAGSGERALRDEGSPGGAASAGERESTAEEEDGDLEEEDTEEDEVQVIDMKKNSEGAHLEQHDSGKEVSPPTNPGCNSPGEKPGEQPSLGKKNDISRHSYSRYNTISYRRIRKGNTKQRIDEFESMMHL